jgi:SAM-dependent methyltransferase
LRLAVTGQFDQLFADRTYLELKNRLFSYQLRRRLLANILRHRPAQILLDLGSGISPVVPPSLSTVYGDLSPAAMRFLSRRVAGHFVALDLSRLPFRTESVPAVVCSEVLEHVERDREALEDIYRVLRPGGELTITVPLHPYYYTFDDRYVGHFRRYRLPDLVSMLEAIGFRQLEIHKAAGVLEKVATYLMARLFARLERRGHRSTGPRWWFTPYRAFNDLWSHVCAWEAHITPMPLITIICIRCRKLPGVRPSN